MSETSSSIKGHFTLETDKNDLEAFLLFDPDPNGPVWNSSLILKLLNENKVKTSLSQADINKAVQDWSQKPDKQLLVAKGEPIKPTIHEYMDWSDLAIPEELNKIAKKILKNAGYPKVFKSITEKTKVEKTIKQKSNIPFIKGKKETKVEWITQRRDVEADVDPVVEHTGYIKKGQIVGVIKAGKMGTPGKNIYGIALKPEKIQAFEIYKSKFLVQQKDKLIAEISGFIRRGNSWIDLIPYYEETIDVSKSENHRICYLTYFPQTGSSEYPDVETIFTKANEIGFKKDILIDSMDLEILLKRAAETGEPLEKQPITKEMAGFVKTYLSSDKSRAYLWAHKGSRNQEDISLKDIGKAINQLSITLNNKDEVKNDILSFFKGSELELKDYLLASGIPATKGKDGSLEWSCEFLDETKTTEIKQKLTELASPTSFREFPPDRVEKIAEVKENQVIAKIIPASQGMTGKDLYGNPIPAIRGNDPDIRVYDHIRISQDTVFAGISGILEYGEKQETIQLRIRDFVNSQIQIETSADMMEAYLTLYPPKGGAEKISEAQIREFLKEKNITKGIQDKLFSEVENAQSQGKLLKNLLIAQGQAPVHGTSSRLVFKVKIQANQDENSSISEPVSLRQGTVIAQILPPATQPADGWDISGKSIKAQLAPNIEIETGKNINVEERENIKYFLAGANGELFYNGKLLEINDSRTIQENVGPKTGHIKFMGSVNIEGSVLPGYRVFSSGNIHVKEDVHESVISAEGSIFIDNMVIGEGKSLLRAKDSMKLGYVESSILLSVGDIRIKEGCRNNQIKCNSRVIIDSENGAIEGGKLQVRKGLETHNLGSEENVKTHISFGQDYLVKDQIEVEEKKINQIKAQIRQYDTKMIEWEKKQEKEVEHIKKIRLAKRNALKIIEKRTFRLFTLREKYEEHFPSELKIKGTLFPGVVLESHGRIHEIKEEKKQIVLYFNTENGKIEEKTIE